MAKIAAKAVNITVNSVAIEDDMRSVSLNVEQETPVVTGLDNAGPRRLAGNYDFDADMQGIADFAAGSSDATLFAMLGSAGVAVGIDPTGATAGAADPNYDSTMVLGSFKLSAAVGGAVELSAKLLGNSALTRAVA